VKLNVLPGSCLIDVSGVGAGAPGGGAGGIAYAQAGGSPAARSPPADRRSAAPLPATTRINSLRMVCLRDAPA
jgi:hypothetical protein